MKKSRQEDLEKNLVAEGLVQVYKAIEPYSKVILAAVVLVVVGLLGLGLYTSGESAKRSDATLQLIMDNPEVAEQYPGTVAASWSKLYQGNQNLAQGINELYQDRDSALTLLEQAKDDFTRARDASEDSILISRASLGLGMAAEALGEIDAAVEAYQQCIAANESEQMTEVAQDRIDRLSDSENKEFLAWFSEQDFSPADPSLPPELPGTSSLPGLPDFSLPELGAPADGSASDGADGSDQSTSDGSDGSTSDGSDGSTSDGSDGSDQSTSDGSDGSGESTSDGSDQASADETAE